MELVFAGLIAGLALLTWGASRTVDSALALAARLNLSAMAIAATLIALGTSLPELVVSINASTKGDSAIAVGNALGSNLANTGLVLGLALLLRPIIAARKILRAEIPLMLLAVAVAGWVLADARLQRLEGLALVLLLAPAIWLLLRGGGQQQEAAAEANTETETNIRRRSLGWEVASLLWYLLLLNLGAELLVRSAEWIAAEFGISPFVIGVSLVAVGTSLPELAVTLAGVLRNSSDVIIGNIMGSNIFNLLGVMGVSAAIHPWQAASSSFLLRDYGTMAALSVLPVLWLTASLVRGHASLTLHRPLGVLLLVGYCLYLYVLFFV